MYPSKLEYEKHRYYSDEEFFSGKFNFIHTYLHADYNLKMHSHQFYEINIIASGEGKHYIADTHRDTEAGDVFIIPPGIDHGYQSNSILNIYHVLIKKDFLIRYGEELSQIENFAVLFDIEPQIRRTYDKKLNLSVSSRILAAFKKELEQMIILGKSRQYVRLNIAALSFIFKLCERMQSTVSLSRESDIIGILEYILNNLDEKLTLNRLSEIAHMSPSTLSRKFRTVMGDSPANYILARRIEKAGKLIAENAATRTEIAHACGFYDVSHMNKYL